MSWIFSFLLLCYLLVRVVLRVRGQIRWLAVRETLPVPPEMVSAPEHLPAPLAGLFVDSLALRAELVRSRRTLAAVAVKDPDAALGRVRDARYRRALMEGWSRLNTWLRAVDHEPELLVDLPSGAQSVITIAALRESLRDKWVAVSRSRALDPFELRDLVCVAQTFERVEQELVGIERLLAQLSAHPYRDRPDAAARPLAPSGG